MTRAEKEIKRIERNLRMLADDLGPLPESSAEEFWHGLVHASRSLGRDIPLERLTLAHAYLGRFLERERLLARLRAGRGTAGGNTSSNGAPSGHDRFTILAQHLLQDPHLPRLIGESLTTWTALSGRVDWQPDDLDETPASHGEDDTLADHLFHETVEAERDYGVARRISGKEGVDNELPHMILSIVRSRQDSMLEALGPGDIKDLNRWFRSVRRATCDYTWLSPEEDFSTPTHQLLQLMRRHDSNFNGPFRRLTDDPEYADLSGEISGAWGILDDLFSQADFDGLVEDLAGGFLPLGSGGGDLINVIPSDAKGACKPVLLALARGARVRDKFGFENVMKGVKKHLIDCQDILKLVVFVTDTWDSKRFLADHFGELSSWRKKDGVRFCFVQVGAPRDQLATMAVDLT